MSRILTGDVREVLKTLPDESVHCCVTSPPYWGLRDYGELGQLGLEATPDEYVANMVAVFRDVRRVLRDDASLWLNLGDSFVDKQLQGIPWRVAFALQADGWWLRSDIIWAKPNPMPESVTGSHFTRHRVTIEEYERLSGLRYIDERAGDDWAGNMPPLSEREVPHRKAPLSAKRAGTGNNASAGAARRSEGETPPVISSPTHPSSEASSNRGGTHGSASLSRDALPAGRSGQGEETARLRPPPSSDRPQSSSVRRGLADDSASAQEPLSLLQEAESADDRPRYPAEQRRDAHSGEHRASMPELQLSEEGQTDSSLLVGCPGCPKCEMHHGYTFHLSAGRPTKAHEYVFLLSKSARYYYDAEAIKEPARDWGERDRSQMRGGTDDPKLKHHGLTGKTDKQRGHSRRHAGFNDRWDHMTKDEQQSLGRNKRSIWTVATAPFEGAHFATFPEALIKPCILAGCPEGGVVLDPFFGSGTTGVVAKRAGRDYIGIELNPAYVAMAEKRIGTQERLL